MLAGGGGGGGGGLVNSFHCYVCAVFAGEESEETKFILT